MRLYITLLAFVFALRAEAQMPNFSISGTIADSVSGAPLEYATFMLFSAQDSSQVTGIASSANGAFLLDSLRPGRYFARVNFIGFELKTLTGLALNRENQRLNLGKILLASSNLTTDEVTVETDRLAVEYHVEKKVINVAQQNIAPTGSAADVLANAPSVSVDIDGSVKLRGSSNFTVMIDGRPSILEANDALAQIPSATIDKIEIITNPSSRFSAEGTAGIINIIPLRRGANGVSGAINARTSIDERRGGDFTLTRPVGKSALTLGGNIGIGHDPGQSRSEIRTTLDDLTTTIKTDGESIGIRDNYSLRAELDVPLSKADNLVFGARFGGMSFGRTSDLNQFESNDQSVITESSKSKNLTERKFHNQSAFSNWKHRFKEDDHILTVDVNYGGRGGDELTVNELFENSGNMFSGIRSTEESSGARLEAKTDYVRPLSGNQKLETGLSTQFGNSKSDNANQELDSLTENYIEQPEFSHETEFQRTIHAGYGMYSGQLKSLEYQVGLRTEYLARLIEQPKTGESFSIDRLDLYPSFASALPLGGAKQLSLSYTRRVEHSRPWYLEPFLTWESSNNVRQGNPKLLPEFIDSYELGYQTNLLGSFASAEGFYRVKHNYVEMTRSLYSESVFLTSPENIGRQFSAGVELRTDVTVRKGWQLNLTSNLFDQRVNGETAELSFDERNFTWDAKLNSIIALRKSTKIQIDGSYTGPTVTSQGNNEQFFIANAAIRQDFMNKSLNIALQIRDIFGSAIHESTFNAPGLYSFDYSTHSTQVITLSAGYFFNNFKQKRDPGRSENGGDDF